MIDHALNFRVGNYAIEHYGVPVLLIHVITGLNLFVAIAKIERPIGIAFQINGRRNLVERGEREHFSADFKDDGLLAEGRPLCRSRLAQTISPKRFDIHTSRYVVPLLHLRHQDAQQISDLYPLLLHGIAVPQRDGVA